jgi:hypothetical protein
MQSEFNRLTGNRTYQHQELVDIASNIFNEFINRDLEEIERKDFRSNYNILNYTPNNIRNLITREMMDAFNIETLIHDNLSEENLRELASQIYNDYINFNRNSYSTFVLPRRYIIEDELQSEIDRMVNIYEAVSTIEGWAPRSSRLITLRKKTAMNYYIEKEKKRLLSKRKLSNDMNMNDMNMNDMNMNYMNMNDLNMNINNMNINNMRPSIMEPSKKPKKH